MPVRIRDYHPCDEQRVVELSLRAWAPVFASMEEVLGPGIFARLHRDWRRYQEKAVRGTLADDGVRAWVAVDGQRGQPVGFAAAEHLDLDRSLGQIRMLAVDPDRQNSGVGTALTESATSWLRESGMRVAMIETGGDSGHAPARRVYDKARYTPIPLVRYFKAL